MAETLRDQLIGAWKLVSYVEKPIDGSPPFHPMGAPPRGIILYTPDGYMSAQLMRPDRHPFASGDWFKGTAAEWGRHSRARSKSRATSSIWPQSRQSRRAEKR
jgi:Lipocalin-like domain